MLNEVKKLDRVGGCKSASLEPFEMGAVEIIMFSLGGEGLVDLQPSVEHHNTLFARYA